MTDSSPKFCFQCARALALRYPGCYLPEDPPEYIRAEQHLPPDQRIHGPEHCHPQGNPEDGPKGMRCPAGHETLDERLETEISLRNLVDPDEFLLAFQEGQRECAEDPEISVEVMEAALTINRYRNERDEAWSRWSKEQERLGEQAEDAELARFEVGKMVDEGDLPEDVVKAGGGWIRLLGKSIYVSRGAHMVGEEAIYGWMVMAASFGVPSPAGNASFADKAEDISAEIAKLPTEEHKEMENLRQQDERVLRQEDPLNYLSAEDEAEELARQSGPFPPHPDDNNETQRLMREEYLQIFPQHFNPEEDE